MGVVYKAKDVRIERTVAIKELLINPSLAKAAEEIIARFHREAQTAGSLQHPNIVTIHDFGEDSGSHYIAMEFIEGKNLKEYMEEGHHFNESELVEILIQTCEGLQHAHERKIVHRDIKPDNISITPKGDVKITDFGIARMSTNNPMMNMTQDGTMLGTLGYISPEQLQDSRRVDHRADIFSLGAMMYELYTQQLPFDGGNLGATILKIVSEDPTPPTRLNADLDPRIEKVIMKALQKLPDFRYQSAREIADELKQIKSSMGGGGQSQANAGMVACPCEKKNMIFAGAKFCPYCGLNLDSAPAPAGPATPQMHTPPQRPMIEDQIKQPMARTPAAPAAAPQRKPEKPGSFRSRLSRLIELASTYQTNPRASFERQSFTRTRETSQTQPTSNQLRST
ncbi:MAG TPA: serine/threonine-protein kinase, partial [Candidatus Obscuribacterales bacterium]